jgi:hypothetical protein
MAGMPHLAYLLNGLDDANSFLAGTLMSSNLMFSIRNPLEKIRCPLDSYSPDVVWKDQMWV